MAPKDLLLALSLCFSLIAPLRGHPTSLVKVQQGWLSGVMRPSENGRLFHAFLGIPYAEPPLDDLRFEDPVPKKPWHSVWPADKDPSICPQLLNGEIIGHEDCLYINVYTPRLHSIMGKGLPVLIYIHGGGFLIGDGRSDHWGPEYILDKDVVLVTIQYRLGILGFLSTGDKVAPGNYGMKDQVLGLHWVQDNIERFGGDPTKVTLSGHSAGGCSVAAHAVSRLSRGLFRRYIVMSGNTYFVWGHHKGPENNYIEIGRKFANLSGCPTSDSLSMVNCLKSANVNDLIEPNSLFDTDLKGAGWGFVVEPPSPHAFLDEDPMVTIETRGQLDLPFMIGTVKDDGLYDTLDYYTNYTDYERFFSTLDEYIQNELEFLIEPEKAKGLVSKVKDFYFPNFSSLDRNSRIQMATDFISDIMFRYPEYDVTVNQLQYAVEPFYSYSFEYRGTFSRTKLMSGLDGDYGVTHADELTYLFKQSPASLGYPNGTYSESDYKMIRLMVDLWTSFTALNDPVSTELKNPFEWKPYTENKYYLRIGDGKNTTTELEENLRGEQMSFWADLVAKNEVLYS